MPSAPLFLVGELAPEGDLAAPDFLEDMEVVSFYNVICNDHLFLLAVGGEGDDVIFRPGGGEVEPESSSECFLADDEQDEEEQKVTC